MIKLIESVSYKEYDFWFTSNRKVGFSFYSSPLDFELTDISEFERNIEKFLKSLPVQLKMRVHYSTEQISHEFNNHSRSNSLLEIGEAKHRLVFHFEMGFSLLKSKNLLALAKSLYELVSIDSLARANFNLININANKFHEIFWNESEAIIQKESYLDTPFEKIGIIKLIKPSKNSISLETLIALKDKLSFRFEIFVSLKKMPDAIARGKYSQAAKRESFATTVSGQTKSQESDLAAAGIELRGDTYFSFEWHLVLKRSSEEELKKDLQKVYNELQGFSDFLIETVGAFPSFMSLQLGSDFHFNGIFEALIEKDEALACYLPLLTYGNASIKHVSASALAFHRFDFSVDFFDHFQKDYNNANLNIIGQSGKGKSVLINRKILADSFDPNTSLIIVDVKGSHTRLVSDLNGEIHHINLKASSGINPFNFLIENKDEKTLETIKTFICELLLDDHEKKLSEIESSIVEEALISFAETKSEYSIDVFLDYLPDKFERKSLLKRFSKKGLLKNIFNSAESSESKSRNRIRYYNFQSIDTASNTAISRAIMASIMADFSYSLTNKSISERLQFISDETPFFINHCFRSYSLISKNVRALNAALILTVQTSNNLIVDGDKSLIDTAASHIFLSGDDNEEIFKNRFNLTEVETSKVFNLSGEQGLYSQFLIKDPLGARIGNLILSKKEYWQATTKASDLSIIEKVKVEFPLLDEDTIIELIARHDLKQQNKEVYV